MIRARIWLVLMVLAVACTTAWAAQPAALTADQLVYPGASVETRIDVNGAAAMALVGGAVDAVAAQVQQSAKAAEEKGEKKPQEVQAQVAAIESARDALKSLQSVKVVVMEAQQAVRGGDLLSHYQGLLGPRGWTPMVTVQGNKEDNKAVMVMLGPAGKGLLAVVNGDKDIVVAMLTTEKPLGELIGMLMKGGSPSMEAVMDMGGNVLGSMMHKPAPPAPPAPPAAPETPEEPEG